MLSDRVDKLEQKLWSKEDNVEGSKEDNVEAVLDKTRFLADNSDMLTYLQEAQEVEVV